MAGIYLHIPFCKKACHYCNFHFSTSLKSKNELLDCLLLELEQKVNYADGETIETIYFGGGTPSLLSGMELNKLLAYIRKRYPVTDDAEITLEANPDDLSEEKLLTIKDVGINRLSIGIQSFQEEDLLFMNRSHNAKQAVACVQDAQHLGLDNISIDLIFGYPSLSMTSWEKNLETALHLNTPHLSCYAMTVEPRTALHHMIDTKKTLPIDADHAAKQYECLMQTLLLTEFEHYEISSFAKPGMRAKHNSNYWNGVKYIGIGPSAHSYNGVGREWNVANNAKYISGIKQGLPINEIETLSREQAINETIMIQLRRREGLSWPDMLKVLKPEETATFLKTLVHFQQQDLVLKDKDSITLTQKGKLFADHIASEWFL